MSYLEQVQKGKKIRPRRVLLYGVHGIGKSTWASKWPNPVFLPTEDGCGDLDVASYPLMTSIKDIYGAVVELGGDVQHDFQTLVIDSADWLERLIWQGVCQKHGKQDIGEFDFGKGYSHATEAFRRLLNMLDSVRNKGMHVVFLAHASAVKFSEPGQESYDRYSPKLHRDASALIQEWADEVFFANYPRVTRTADEGFGKKRNIAIESGERQMFTSETAAFLAKNRLGLPASMPLDFESLKPYLKAK